MISFKQYATALIGLAQIATASNITALLSQLSPAAEVFYPYATNWTDTTQRWTTYEEPTFFASIKPNTTLDVQRIVKYASTHNIPFLAMGGGHGYTTTFAELQYGLEIDLSGFNQVAVDADANLMTIGGGVRFRDIFEPLYSAGKEIQTGSGSCVGMVGATLGAGVGRYQGIHGLIIDALESVQLVTSNGSLITVSKTQEPDLFWGMRGAGFNFGIVTEATYTIYDLTNNGSVLNADFLFPASANGSFFEILASFNGTLPQPLSLFTLVINDTTYGPSIILNAAYAGPKSEGLAHLQPFLDLPYHKRNITQLTWNVLDTSALFGMDADFCIDGDMHNLWALGVARIDVPTHIAFFNTMVDFYYAYPEATGSSYEIEFFSTQAVRAVKDEETAYPYRDITAHVMLTFAYDDASLSKPVNDLASRWISRFNATSGFDRLQVYVSYAHGTESLDAWYGAEKLPRLLELKKKWDPKGLFVYNNGLPVGN
ncbi:FAD-dependent oxidase [Aspergillus piperis CBS 112811]|uniref:FAD-dependent oxidase n=1 Tax=Aspergillus piperis CBS 112811 TaxID=1448313 RepID=A0A8G1VIC8_9EURO|nr:FAD-dependent oxidase [Aspergillus piperis CBS 112811]RAH54231.1 FAD-dependent oxidase [Aspergillus piperis CBS 112811]